MLPSPTAITLLTSRRLEEPLRVQVVHQVVRIVTVPGGSSRIGPCRRRAPGLAVRPPSPWRDQLAEQVELRRRREIQHLLEIGHEVDLAAALEGVHALLRGDHDVAVEIGRALLELGEILDRSSGPAASRTAAGYRRRAATRVLSPMAIPLRSRIGCEVGRAVLVPVRMAVKASRARAGHAPSGDRQWH